MTTNMTTMATQAAGLTDDERWEIVQARDARFDAAFVFAVRSTGIYCRPRCPARRPRRENVRFFADPSEAEAAGFRPCKRCQPAGDAPRAELARRAQEWIDEHLDETITLAVLGQKLGVSPSHLQRTFKEATGFSPREYIQARRFERARELMRSGDDVTSAIYNAGYGSGSRFYEQASERLGMTPTTYRRGGKGMTIRYAIVDCPLGRLLVGATERGICWVSLGATDETLEAALSNEYPAAILARDDETLQPQVNALLAHLEERREPADLQLEVDGTEFQRRVWEALRMIPYGQTRSYGEVAAAIGRPEAVRAVAQACGSNRLALVIPCHRVVRADGSLGGYRWGVERKRALLEREREARSA